MRVVLNPAIKKIALRKLSSILVSKIIKISVLPFTCKAENWRLFLIEFIFIWAKISLFTLSLSTVFSVMFYALYFFAVRSSLKLHSSSLGFGLPPSICQWRTLDISILLNRIVKCNLPLLKCWVLIFLYLSIKKMFFSLGVLLNVNLLLSPFPSTFCHQFSK